MNAYTSFTLEKGSVKQLHPFWATLHDDITNTAFLVASKLQKKNIWDDTKCAQSRQHVKKINLWGVFMHTGKKKCKEPDQLQAVPKSQEAAQMQFGKWGRDWTLPPVHMVKALIKESSPSAGSQSGILENILSRMILWQNPFTTSFTPTDTYVPLNRSICGKKEMWQCLLHYRNTWLAGHWRDSVLIVMFLIFNEVTLDYVQLSDLELSTTATVNLYL